MNKLLFLVMNTANTINLVTQESLSIFVYQQDFVYRYRNKKMLSSSNVILMKATVYC